MCRDFGVGHLPSEKEVNQMDSGDSHGDGGGPFCMVQFPSGENVRSSSRIGQ